MDTNHTNNAMDTNNNIDIYTDELLNRLFSNDFIRVNDTLYSIKYKIGINVNNLLCLCKLIYIDLLYKENIIKIQFFNNILMITLKDFCNVKYIGMCISIRGNIMYFMSCNKYKQMHSLDTYYKADECSFKLYTFIDDIGSNNAIGSNIAIVSNDAIGSNTTIYLKKSFPSYMSMDYINNILTLYIEAYHKNDKLFSSYNGNDKNQLLPGLIRWDTGNNKIVEQYFKYGKSVCTLYDKKHKLSRKRCNYHDKIIKRI